MPSPDISPLVFDGASLAYELRRSVDQKKWNTASPITPVVPLQRRFLDWQQAAAEQLHGRRRLGTACVSEQPATLKHFCRDYDIPYEPRDSGTVALSAVDLSIRWDHAVEPAEVARHDPTQSPKYKAYDAVRIPRHDAVVYEYADHERHERYTIAKINTGQGFSLFLTTVEDRPKSVVDLMLHAQRLHDDSQQYVATDSYYSVVVPTVRYETTTNLGWLTGLRSTDYQRQVVSGVQKFAISMGNHSAPNEQASPEPLRPWPRHEPRVALRFTQPLFGWCAVDDLPVVQAAFYLPMSTWKQLPAPRRRAA
jgi:hypothetical protein